MSGEIYNRLKEIQRDYPELTLDNQGYQYLPPKIQEKHADQIKEISALCRKAIAGFVKFNNFKPRKSGTFDVRVQYVWDPGKTGFVGVGYFNIEEFKEEDKGE